MWDTILKAIIGIYFDEKMLKKHNMNRALKNPKFKDMILKTSERLKKNDKDIEKFNDDLKALIDKV
mgnify:CR=1 FL=1